MRETPRAGHRAKNGKCSGSLAKRMQTMLVKAGHPHVPTVSPFFFFLVKPLSYSRTAYTDGRGDDGENTKAEARGLRAQLRAARVQHARA